MRLYRYEGGVVITIFLCKCQELYSLRFSYFEPVK